MATFRYTGRDTNGNVVKGLVAADTVRLARDRLRGMGLSIRRISQRMDRNGPTLLHAWQRRRLSHPLTEFLRELATLLQAGVPLLEAIDCCMSQTQPGLHGPIASLRERVAGGDSFADAMGSESWLFDDMIQGMVRVGEHAGNLDEVLDQIAGFREQSSQLQNRVVSAVMYPAIVLTVSVGVTLFLMTVVVPMLLKNLAELGNSLPWPTRVLKAMSDALLLHGWWCGLVLAGLTAIAMVWLQTKQGKLLTSRWLLKIPLLGSLIRKQAVGRVSLVVACLLRSGVELVEALTIAAHACSNLVVKQALVEARVEIERGANLREALAKHRVIPPSVAQIFALGQQSGQLEAMLQRLGEDYDRQSAMLAGRLTSVAEPLLILILSVIVGFILFATVLPILEAGNVLSN